VQVSTLFEPMLERCGWRPTGATALEVAVPNLGKLEWDQILAFRQEPGAQEARAMLKEFERVAIEQEPGDAREFLRKISQAVTAALFETISATSVGATDIAKEAAKGGISVFLPPVGVVVAVSSVLEAAATARRQARSGVAALMKLRGEGRAL
jgi:hypothetical protein